jgi:hypothetical protein
MPSSTRFRRAADGIARSREVAAPTCSRDDNGTETSIVMFRPRMSPRRCPPTLEEYGHGGSPVQIASRDVVHRGPPGSSSQRPAAIASRSSPTGGNVRPLPILTADYSTGVHV